MLYLPTVPRLCILPGHSFAVHKPSISSFHYFKTQVRSIHTDKTEKEEEGIGVIDKSLHMN